MQPTAANQPPVPNPNYGQAPAGVPQAVQQQQQARQPQPSQPQPAQPAHESAAVIGRNLATGAPIMDSATATPQGPTPIFARPTLEQVAQSRSFFKTTEQRYYSTPAGLIQSSDAHKLFKQIPVVPSTLPPDSQVRIPVLAGRVANASPPENEAAARRTFASRKYADPIDRDNRLLFLHKRRNEHQQRVDCLGEVTRVQTEIRMQRLAERRQGGSEEDGIFGNFDEATFAQERGAAKRYALIARNRVKEFDESIRTLMGAQPEELTTANSTIPAGVLEELNAIKNAPPLAKDRPKSDATSASDSTDEESTEASGGPSRSRPRSQPRPQPAQAEPVQAEQVQRSVAAPPTREDEDSDVEMIPPPPAQRKARQEKPAIPEPPVPLQTPVKRGRGRPRSNKQSKIQSPALSARASASAPASSTPTSQPRMVIALEIEPAARCRRCNQPYPSGTGCQNQDCEVGIRLVLDSLRSSPLDEATRQATRKRLVEKLKAIMKLKGGG